MTISSTPTAMQDIVDNAEERELWIVGREFERPPYFIAGKGGDTRLTRALRLCVDEKITPNSDGSYKVEGSAGRLYRVADSCSCPNSQHAKSRWCYHAVGVALYIEWHKRLRPAAPVTLGTLRPGTLPLPPTTVEERLALSTMPDAPALQTHHTPLDDTRPGQAQEDRMPDDDAQYIAEPDDAPVTVLAPTVTTPALRPLAPAEDDLEQALQTWTSERAVVQRFLKTQMVEGNDFYSLRIKGRETKPVLSKAGSEKFLGLMKLNATFAQDTATWTMLGQPEGTLCYVCTLHTRSGEVVGEGRGARTIQQDGGDINKAIKMACKSAQVDAVLRTGALSDCFTQDLEETTTEPAKAVQPSADLRRRIWTRVQELAPDVSSREDVERFIQERTGFVLHPDFYGKIIEHLER